jgi:antitoxin component YwqK of YwqJK toxin-antitoxin module
MKAIVIIGSLLIGFSLNAQELIHASKPVQASQEKFNGEHLTYFDNGNVKAKQTVVDGISHGAYTLYHENGVVREQGAFDNGKKTGEWKRYGEQNQLVGIANFVDGQKHGNWKIWDNNGVLRYDMSYQNDSKVDIWYMYDETGNLVSELVHK